MYIKEEVVITVSKVHAVIHSSSTEVVLVISGVHRRMVSDGWTFGWVSGNFHPESTPLSVECLYLSMDEFHQLGQLGEVVQQYQHDQRSWLRRIVQTPTRVVCDVQLLTSFFA